MEQTHAREDLQPEESAPAYDDSLEERRLSIMDVLLVLARHPRLVGITTAIFVALALGIAIATPSKYTSVARVVRNTTSSQSGGLLGGVSALRGLGITLGPSEAFIGENTYPDILKSREVRLAIARSSFYIPDLGTTMTLVEYFDRRSIFSAIMRGLYAITIGLPRTIIDLFKGAPPDPGTVAENLGSNYAILEEEENAIENLAATISVGVDRRTGIMVVSSITTDPLLSAQLTEMAIDQLAQRVREIYTEKTKEDLAFIQSRFAEAQQELEKSEAELAEFTDRNRDPRTAKLRVEMERLQRQVLFKTQLYSELQAQLTQTEIDLQRNQPIITVLEAPVPPTRASGPRRKVMVLFSLFLGLGVGMGLAFVSDVVKRRERDETTQAKLVEIKVALISPRIRKWLRIS
ncbi:MAG: Wzz/FepE/Etk N-terminal domain-containing protein [Candidatus Neomarinimicrobiota bacterium]